MWQGLERGAHPVGFQRLGGSVALWYPAGTDGAAMTLRDCYTPEAAGEYAAFLAGAGLSSGAIDAMFAAAMAARRDASALTGRYPVILVGQGNAQDAPDQAVLAEYLASHGYIVAAPPSPMLAAPMTSESQVGALAEQQASDLADALRMAGASNPAADPSRAGVIGHSFGARAALLFAMRDARVKALVSLDGGIGTATAAGSFRSAPSFDTTKAVAPILHYYERLDPFMTPDFALLEDLPANVTSEEIPDMHHVHFTTLGFAAAMLPEIATLTGAGPAIRRGVRRVAQGTLDFLATHVADGRGAPRNASVSVSREQ